MVSFYRFDRHMNKGFFLALALSLLALTGCAISGRVADSVPTGATIQKVAVISVTARTFTRRYTGMTVFNNELEKIDIQDWKVDPFIEDSVRRVLNDMGIVTVSGEYPIDEFSHVNDLNGPYDAPAFWGPNWSKIEKPAMDHCSQHGLDALVIIAEARTGDFLTGSNQSFGGVGVYGRGIGNVSVLHLVSYVGIVDCKTGKVLATRRLSASNSDSFGDINRETPRVYVPLVEIMRPISQWTDEQKIRYKGLLNKLPGLALKQTLGKLLNKP